MFDGLKKREPTIKSRRIAVSLEAIFKVPFLTSAILSDIRVLIYRIYMFGRY